jgi:hypothetical protein
VSIQHVLRILRVLLPALAAGAIGAAAAAADKPADNPAAYSHVIPVTVSGKEAVVQLPLPRAVYLQARSADLRDLRLFDAGGTPLPFALVERVREDGVARARAPVAVFPVRAPAGAAQDGLQIRTREDGTLVSVRAPASEAGDVLASLILDLQPPPALANSGTANDGSNNGSNNASNNGSRAIAALDLMPPASESSYSARVMLEASDDLQHWVPVTDAALSWLVNSQGGRVQKNRIEFAPRSFRYARLSWLEGKPVEFAAITADWVTELRTPAQWDSLVLQPTPGRSGEDLVYAAPLAIPVASVGLVFQGQNIVLPAAIGQYRDLPQRQAGEARGPDLRTVASATFYRLTQNGQQRESGDVDVAPTHASQWVLRPQAQLAERPGLRLRWQAETIVFLAGGKGPYTLAFGRNGVQPAYLPLAQVAPGFSRGELATLELAQAGAPVQQHGPETAATDGDASGHAAWLWALLLCGVAALGFMAWRLVKQLKDAPPGQPPV